jgi:hypothetical protein
MPSPAHSSTSPNASSRTGRDPRQRQRELCLHPGDHESGTDDHRRPTDSITEITADRMPSSRSRSWFPIVSAVALVMVGFLTAALSRAVAVRRWQVLTWRSSLKGARDRRPTDDRDEGHDDDRRARALPDAA